MCSAIDMRRFVSTPTIALTRLEIIGTTEWQDANLHHIEVMECLGNLTRPVGSAWYVLD